MSKKIGIVSWPIGSSYVGVTSPYVEYFNQFGDVVFVSYDEIRYDLDLLVLPGGPDVDPERYQEKPHRLTGKACPQREYFDRYMLKHYIEAEVPVFGICRGMQSLAVYFGGKMIQHIYGHPTNPSDKRFKDVHEIYYKYSGTKDPKSIGVNSIHHQVVDDENLPDELKVIARYAEFNKNRTPSTIGTIEAFVHTKLNIASVQFHPEELLFNPFANNLVISLLDNSFSANNYEEIKPYNEVIHRQSKI